VLRTLVLALSGVIGASCDPTLDAGDNESTTKLPVDKHNPVILLNDSARDNWSPEYAALFANDGLKIVGVVVTSSEYWPDLEANLGGWREFITAARQGGLAGLPDPVPSTGAQLVVPPDRLVESTRANHSAGADLILRKSQELALPGQPLVVLCGTQLTDLADAYLTDPTVADRVVVVAQIGSYSALKASMSSPNGDLDPWADWIVAQHFRYVQVSVSYEQSSDVTANDLTGLPKSSLVTWLTTKQASLAKVWKSSDQGPVLAVAEPGFITTALRSVVDTSGGFNSPAGQGPPLTASAVGSNWLVTDIDPTVPRARMLQLLSKLKAAQP
jgi:hypothetical protein